MCVSQLRRRSRRHRGRRRRRRPARYMRADFSFCHRLAAAFGSFPFLRVLLLCSRSVGPFALSRTAWHTRGQRNDGMRRDGSGLRRTADSVNVSLLSFSSFSRSPFLLYPCLLRPPSCSFSTARTPFCVHHSALSILHTIYRLYSSTFDTRCVSLSFSFFPLTLLFRSFTLLSFINIAFEIGLFPMLSRLAGHCKAGGVCERRDTMLCLRTAGLTYFVC